MTKTLSHTPIASDEYPLETVMRIIDEEHTTPMSPRDIAALDRGLGAYGPKQAKKIGIKEPDIPQLIHESRARRRKA